MPRITSILNSSAARRRRAMASGAVLAVTCAVGATVLGATPAQAASSTRVVSCSAGNFTGYAEVATTASNGTISATLKQYRIQKHAGQSGGNKANVNLTVGQFTVKSADRMMQDGAWHWLGLNASAHDYVGGVQFIFDKSGADPRCNASFEQR
jgi:hypothetical protein